MVLIGIGSYYAGLRQGANEAPLPAPTNISEPAAVTEPAPAHPAIPSGIPGMRKPGSSGQRYTHFQVGNSNVKAILADDPLIWIGTGGGVIRYNFATQEHKLFDVRSGLLSNGVFHLGKIDGRLAVGTYGGGLSLLNPRTEDWDNYNIQHGLADAFVYDVLETSSGDIWVATWSGANRVREGKLDSRDHWDTFTVENTNGGLPNDWVYGLRAGLKGDVWFATEGGVALYRDGRWRNWKHTDGVGAPYEQVRGQIEFSRDPAKESSHHARQKAEQGLQGVDVAYNPNYIVALEVDPRGVVWAGTWGGGLARFDGTAWRNYTVTDGLPSVHVWLLRLGPDGSLWAGTSKGLAKMTGDRFTVYTMKDGLFADNVFSIAFSPRGGLWVGGYGGVAQFEGLPGMP